MTVNHAISTFWACEPKLLGQLVLAGRIGNESEINRITDSLHELHPHKQRRRGEGGGFIPTSERLLEARGLAAKD